jgi:DNA invertase Pin-like site-specific DNA recombinase
MPFSNILSERIMAVFGYGRVSTVEQTADNQRLEIERAGYTVEYWFADTVSGKAHAAQRKQFSFLLGKLRARDTLVVSKLDRLGRDAPDVLATIKMLAALDVEAVVLQLGKLDLTSPAGKLMLTMLAAVAEMERDLIVERTQAGLARAKAEGKILGRPSKTTPEQRKAMIQGYATNQNVSALAKLYGVSRATVLAIVKPTACTTSPGAGQPRFVVSAAEEGKLDTMGVR